MPIIAIVREIRRIAPKELLLTFYYIGPKDPFGDMLISQEGIEIKNILAGKIRRYFTWRSLLENVADLFKIPIGILQSFFYVFVFAPDLILSKGGYGSFPAVFAGWILQVPIFLHESDVSPGLASKVQSPFAFKIFTSFPKTEYFSLKKVIYAGNPIRREILEGSKEEARKIFNLTLEKPVILITGGSQGAQKINDTILDILPGLLDNFELIHVCGENNLKQIGAEAKAVITKEAEKYYHLYPFLKEIEIKHAYLAADLIISRAGSGSIFEIAAVGKPSILVPLSGSAQNHQIKNAYAYGQEGTTIVMEEENLTPHFFLEKLKYLFSHHEELEKMSIAAKSFAKPEAARLIAQYLLTNY